MQEFLQKPVLENVHFVQVTSAPSEVRLIANIPGFENRILPQLALDADSVVLRVRRAQIRIKAAHNAPAECLIRHMESLRVGVSGESKVRNRERTGYDIRQGVERRQVRRPSLARDESRGADRLTNIRSEIGGKELRAFVIVDEGIRSPNN